MIDVYQIHFTSRATYHFDLKWSGEAGPFKVKNVMRSKKIWVHPTFMLMHLRKKVSLELCIMYGKLLYL